MVTIFCVTDFPLKCEVCSRWGWFFDHLRRVKEFIISRIFLWIPGRTCKNIQCKIYICEHIIAEVGIPILRSKLTKNYLKTTLIQELFCITSQVGTHGHSMDVAICLWIVHYIMITKFLAAWMVETRSRVFISTSRTCTILSMRMNVSKSNMVETTWLPVNDLYC